MWLFGICALALALFGATELFVAWRLRLAAYALADEHANARNELEVKFQELSHLSRALSIEHAASFRAMSQFVSLWNDGERDEAVEVLKGAGFRIAA